MSNAERQSRHREKVNKKLERLKNIEFAVEFLKKDEIDDALKWKTFLKLYEEKPTLENK